MNMKLLGMGQSQLSPFLPNLLFLITHTLGSLIQAMDVISIMALKKGMK